MVSCGLVCFILVCSQLLFRLFHPFCGQLFCLFHFSVCGQMLFRLFHFSVWSVSVSFLFFVLFPF